MDTRFICDRFICDKVAMQRATGDAERSFEDVPPQRDSMSDSLFVSAERARVTKRHVTHFWG